MLEKVLSAAGAAREPFAALPAAARAEALRRVADTLDAAEGELVPLAHRETHLPETPRLHHELERTTFQLRLLAETVVEGAYLEVVLDSPDTYWPAGGRVDLRRMLVPVGPVAVFGASNFPFAFGVAGGDTAAALAVGCPVVVKANPGHPLLSDRIAELVSSALSSAGVPAGAFGVVHGFEEGRQLVVDHRIRAGAFTGSLAGGRALFDLACSRPDPIPFYAEMGSVNPVFVTASAAADRPEAIAEGYVGSFTLGAGQFCTKPGLLFLPEGHGLEDVLREAVSTIPAQAMLNERIAAGYSDGLEKLRGVPGVEVLSAADEDGPVFGPTLLATTGKDFLADSDTVREECFGPASLIVTYTDQAELISLLGVMEPGLTATIQGEESDVDWVRGVIPSLTRIAGRLLWNDWPTGVTVSWAQEHGGPYPATTAPTSTSVGTAAIERFLRPIAWQGFPDALLPEPLQENNPWNVPRRTDGKR
jgi:NADP-dependent aldehyde dehydrogenase